MNRREFTKTLVAGGTWLATFGNAFAEGAKDSAVGKPWKGWKKGEFQVHFIYTGVGESMFYIFPDGTTMLLDCGDHAAHERGKLAVPILPDMSRHSGEWIARYVQRVNPSKNDVDYMFVSHFHADHTGWSKYHAGKTSGRVEDYYLSGFAHAAEFLNFKKCIDRGYPNYDEPRVLKNSEPLNNMKSLYKHLQSKGDFTIEKFRVGEVDQVAMMKEKGAYKNFSILNVCANGKIWTKDGGIIDVYADRPKNKGVNENGLCLGLVFRYGDFSFFSGGDFSDKIKRDGKVYMTEDALGPHVGHVDVCKVNHHGHYSMPSEFIRSVSSRFYVSCVWDQLHNVDPVMARLSDTSIYPGKRTICPGIFPKERREADKGKAWLANVPVESYEGGHIVLNVAEGGKDYSLTYLTAKDESMLVTSVLRP